MNKETDPKVKKTLKWNDNLAKIIMTKHKFLVHVKYSSVATSMISLGLN